MSSLSLKVEPPPLIISSCVAGLVTGKKVIP
jgi:hypothetical protein